MPEPVPLPVRYRPFGARLAAGLAGLVLPVAMAYLWLMLPGEVQEDFSIAQRVTLVGFLAAILALLYGIFRTNATADEAGLTVVNGYKRRRYDWPEVVKITLTPNRPWALLDLADGDTLSVMAIQVSDGRRAIAAARELAGILAERSRTDRND